MRHAIEKAIFAFQRIEMAHPSSSEHSRDMYQTAAEARRGLLKVLAEIQDLCPGHVASSDDPKICGRCGIHIDSLRPPEPESF